MNELLTSSSTRRPNKQRRFQQQNTLLNTHINTKLSQTHSPGRVWRRTSRRWTCWKVSVFERLLQRQNMRSEIYTKSLINTAVVPHKTVSWQYPDRTRNSVLIQSEDEGWCRFICWEWTHSPKAEVEPLAVLRMRTTDYALWPGCWFRALLERAQRHFTMPQKLSTSLS